jgi:hypothetical protein
LQGTKLGEYIRRDTQLLQKLGWTRFVSQRRRREDLVLNINVNHPAANSLQLLQSEGAPVRLSTPDWSEQRLRAAYHRGPHKSTNAFSSFLADEFADMVDKSQWVVLPWSVARHLPGLRLSPAGCVPQRNRRPRLIADYSYYDVNLDTHPDAPHEAMQFGRALQRYIHAIVHANPAYGPVHMMKVDVADGYYRVWVRCADIPKLGVVLPDLDGSGELLVALPMALPMGWVSSPPWFCAASKTIADLANGCLLKHQLPLPHHLEADAMTMPAPDSVPHPRQDTSTSVRAPHSQPFAPGITTPQSPPCQVRRLR